jgi:SRSO17 transposase
MDVPASPAALPALHECLASFQVRCRRPEGREALERSTTGLLTEVPNKNGDTLAQAVPGTREQRWQEFLTNRPWDEEDLNRQRVQKMVAEASTGDGVLVVDATGFPKQGKASVGVERQYSGTLGKVGNGQMAVTRCDTDRRATWPVAVQWYLPKTWAYDPERQRAIEPFHEEAKGELGWDQYQGRLWPGFHRHAVTVTLAYRFLVWLERRERRGRRRQGRPGDAFSPSADCQAPDTPSGAS